MALPLGNVAADREKRSPPVAIRYGKGLIGGAVVVALLALLVHWIGINTFELYRDDLLFYLQAHLILVLVSMLAALVVGIPAGILLSRPHMVGRAERFMQIFNIGNTVPPLAVLAIALGVLGIGMGGTGQQGQRQGEQLEHGSLPQGLRSR